MAKNKNPTALFDVIHAAKAAQVQSQRQHSCSQVVGKDKKPLKNVAEEGTENVGKQKSWLLAAKQSVGLVTPPPAEAAPCSPEQQPLMIESSESVETVAPVVKDSDSSEIAAEPASAKVRFIDRFKTRSAPEQAIESVYDDGDDAPLPVFYSTTGDPKPEPVATPPRRQREKMVSMDPIRGDIVFSLSYGGTIAAGFILVIAMAIAFVAGTHTQITSNETSDVPKAESAPGRLAEAVPSPANASMLAAISPAPSPIKPTNPYPVYKPEALDITPKTARQNPETPAAPSAPLPIKATRDIGVMYMVIQSYPDQELAQKAGDFVNRAGIPCTLVQGLSAWAPRDWYSVVGLKPYKKHDPALEQDEHSLTILGTKFSNKIYNQFQPQGYTWRTDSDPQ